MQQTTEQTEHDVQPTQPYVLGRDEGRKGHFLNNLVTQKVTASNGGSLVAVEANAPKGFGPPLHSHDNEDEIIFVLDGEVRFECGGEAKTVGAGGLAYFPHRHPPHVPGPVGIEQDVEHHRLGHNHSDLRRLRRRALNPDGLDQSAAPNRDQRRSSGRSQRATRHPSPRTAAQPNPLSGSETPYDPPTIRSGPSESEAMLRLNRSTDTVHSRSIMLIVA